MDFLRLTDYRTGEPRLVNKADIVLVAPHHMGSRLTIRPDTLIECKESFEDVAILLGETPAPGFAATAAPEKPAPAKSEPPVEKATK